MCVIRSRLRFKVGIKSFRPPFQRAVLADHSDAAAVRTARTQRVWPLVRRADEAAVSAITARGCFSERAGGDGGRSRSLLCTPRRRRGVTGCPSGRFHCINYPCCTSTGML
jgi:hypothetical protein